MHAPTSTALHPETLQFERRTYPDPETGRSITQITSGQAHCYPLYYFIPTTTEDGATIIFHRWAGDEIQMYRMEVATGEAKRLTNASTPRAAWRPWTQPPTRGVRDQLSAFNVPTRELIYYDGNEIRSVQIDTLEDRLIYEVAADRIPCSLTGVSPDGQWFAFAHIERGYLENPPPGGPKRAEGVGCVIQLVELATGKSRQLLCINTWVTHVNWQDNRRILFCHPPTENGLLVMDIEGNWYTHVRTQDGPYLKGPVPIEQTSHYQATDLGIVYEMRTRIGLCDPYTFECLEYEVADYPVAHIGRDPQARFFCFDTKRPNSETGYHDGPRCICYLPELKFNQPNQPNQPELILSRMPTYGEGQHSHLHPVLTADRKNILFIGGDERTQTNHICLLDVSDLGDTQREIPA